MVLSWNKLESATVDVGFQVTPRGGSIFTYAPPAVLAEHGSITLHQPRGAKVEGLRLLCLGHRQTTGLSTPSPLDDDVPTWDLTMRAPLHLPIGTYQREPRYFPLVDARGWARFSPRRNAPIMASVSGLTTRLHSTARRRDNTRHFPLSTLFRSRNTILRSRRHPTLDTHIKVRFQYYAANNPLARWTW
jgi:hypothetical protein